MRDYNNSHYSQRIKRRGKDLALQDGGARFRLRWVLLALVVLLCVLLIIHFVLTHSAIRQAKRDAKHAVVATATSASTSAKVAFKTTKKATANQPQKAETKSPKHVTPQKPKIEKPVFDFYHMLPGKKKARLDQMQKGHKATSGAAS